VVGGRDNVLRGRMLRLVVSAALLILVGNLFLMMVPQHGYYQGKALRNRQDQFRVRAPRGRILDRHGTVVADNMFIADITVPARALGEAGPDSTLERLLTWFDLPREETLQRLEQQKQRRRGRLVLVANATMPQIAAVEERGRELPDVRVEARSRRRYGYRDLVAHVVGYVGEVGQADLDTTGGPLGYRLGDMVGKQGIEAAFEERLRGANGLKLEEVNATGRIVGRDPVWLREVVPGRDVTLALSLPLQARLVEIIGDRPAAAVALDVRSGEVLAAVSLPSFDPNLLTTSISAEDWNRLVNDPAKPFFNRIVQATYPPGSLYKPVTSLAALELGLVGPHGVLDPCNGGMTFGDRLFRCWKRAGHGSVDHVEAMAQSCDTYYYQLGLRLDIDQLARAARAFGLGRRCSAIFPEEAEGNVPDSAWYDRRFGEGRWTRGVLLNNAIGQGEILVTPVQMAVLAGRLATAGRMPDPVFVIEPASEAEPPAPLPFSASHLAWAREALRVTVADGTGRGAALPDVAVAGKTGTAQNPHGEDHAWFMAFAPAEAPEVAIAVILENAGSGGAEAAPVAQAWLEEYFRLAAAARELP
jgi:penicillin-binding protein 2